MSYKRPRTEFESNAASQVAPFVAYGTPLPPLDPNVRDDGSFVPVWKQDATDERGRKRFHGAFTGGFSAGYFNTVGSVEGWAPSTFVSSRSNRRKDGPQQLERRPEDYMDDEDMTDLANSQTLTTSDTFAALGSTETDERWKGSLIDLLRPQHETMGVKLLRRMGWRDGQGIGAHTRRAIRVDESMEVDPDPDTHLFAPQNPHVVTFKKKQDTKGLGYNLGDRLVQESNDQQTDPREDDRIEDVLNLAPPKPRKPPERKNGFGIGVLQDTGSDDEDVYSIGPQIAYNKTVGGGKKSKKANPKNSALPLALPNPSLKTKPIYTPKKDIAGAFRRCHDGRLPLDGFLLCEQINNREAAASSLNASRIKAPEDWAPPTALEGQDGAVVSSQSLKETARHSQLNPASRAAILGEAQLPGKSVFDFLSKSARDRIAMASGKEDLPPARQETQKRQAEHSDSSELPHVDKNVALAALGRGVHGWMPYVEDELKRSRYRAFLEWHGGVSNTQSLRCPVGWKHDAWIQELQEFAHAAQVFKPMTGMMASRFQSSSNIQTSTSDQDDTPILELGDAPTKTPDPAEEAAKMGMYGPMTRSSQQFFPTRLVYKRFGIKPLVHLDEQVSGSSMHSHAAKESPNSTSELSLHPNSNKQYQRAASVDEETKASNSVDVSGQLAVATVDPSVNEALESQRAADDLFKAIFGPD